MTELNKQLSQIGEEYLIGLANKGIVKRAYKDKEDTPVEVETVAEEAQLKVGEETVKIRFPLGESICSCPSRSICRHVILGILVLQESVSKESETAGPPSVEDPLLEQLRKEIEEYPLSTLKKLMGTRNYQGFLRQMKSRIGAKISMSSVAVVTLPGEEHKVTLLSPLAHSSCTCHKKEMCAHKAEAILWCKLHSGMVSEEELSEELLDGPAYDLDKIKDAAKQMQVFLTELLKTGLPRTSPDILEYLDRLAITAHDAALADFEGDFRALHDSYRRYINRVATFETSRLLTQIMVLYRKVSGLLTTDSSAEITALAGEFRADYLEAGDLHLFGVAAEEFQSAGGYAGETIYFLEEQTGEWYSYTVARPIFYDTKKKRRNPGMAQAPWGLEIPLEGLVFAEVRLKNAKCDNRNRLSSSKDTGAEVTLNRKDFSWQDTGWYYRDFRELFLQRIPKLGLYIEEKKETALVFLQPAACEPARFDETKQRLSMTLYDGNGRDVVVELSYSKREDANIRYLERVRLEQPPIFFGRIYLRDGKIRMYPISLLDPAESLEVVNSEKEENLQEEKMTSIRVLLDHLEEVRTVLENVFQSGIDTPVDSVLEEMGRRADLSKQYGLGLLSDLLVRLKVCLSMNRHRLSQNDEEAEQTAVVCMEQAVTYVNICIEKAVYDLAATAYTKE